MDNTTHKPRFHIRLFILSCLLSSSLFSSQLAAEVVNGGVWVIKSGDSLYKIARIIFPESTKKQAQLRRELVVQNPEIFKNGNHNIAVGDELQLPAFAIKQDESAVGAIMVAPAISPTPQTAPQAASQTPAITEPVISKTNETTPKISQPSTPAPETSQAAIPDPQDIIGRVVINVGSLSAENRGTTRQLSRRSSIYRGDTLLTGDRSLTQIRLKDGALIALRPHTNIRISEFNYNGSEDGSERSVIELLRGGFRTITGAIGHLNKQNYQVRTSMATIGIRGTHYSLVLCQQSSCNGNGESVDDGLYGGVADGSIVIENQTGVHTFNNDQFFHLTSSNALPQETLLPPQALNPGKGKHTAKNSKDKSSSKKLPHEKSKSIPRRLAIIFEPNQPNPVRKRLRLPKDINNLLNDIQLTKAPNGSAALIGFNETDQFTATGSSAPVLIIPVNDNIILLGPKRTPVEIIEETINLETGFVEINKFFAASPAGIPATLVPSSVGSNLDAGVNWGRWNGDFTILIDGTRINAGNDLHFIYSENITSTSQLANLGGIKGSFVNYTSIDGTLPTDNQGNIGNNIATITMDADFIGQQITGYTVSATIPTTAGDVFYQAGILAPVPFSELNDSFPIDGTSCAGGACVGGASVLFIGPQATGAITSYQINDVQSSTSITGTALLAEGQPQF